MSATSTQGTLLRIYLEDHVAGATAGTQRAARLADAEASSPDSAALATLATDIATDREALLALMEVLGIEPSRVKNGLASAGEKLGSLKLNGRVTDRSPLSAIIEIEALQMAVRGKRSLWETLLVTLNESGSIDISDLIARADDQLEVLAALHARRVAATFAAQPG